MSMILKRKRLCCACGHVCFYAAVFAGLSFGYSPVVHAENELHVANEFSYTYNDVSGPGSSQSSLRKGFSYLNTTYLNGNGNLNGYDYNLNLGLKLTDDPANDINVVSLTNLQGRISNKMHTLNMGDTFESFSQYALSTAIKGASYRYVSDAAHIPEVTAVYGYAYPRWDNFFGISDGRVEAVERLVTGVRAKENFTEDLWAGFSYVQSQDNHRINTTDPLYSNNAYTLDLEYRPINGLTITGESSFSDQKESPSEGVAETVRHGNANKITIIGDGAPSRVTLEYERISPNFTTLVGSATPDREKMKAKWRYKYNRDVSTNLGFLWFRDNLDGQKSRGRTDYYKPEAGLTVKRLFGRQYSISDFTYKLDISSNDTADTLNHIINLNYQDRFGIFDSETNLGYTHYDNKTAAAARTSEYTYNTSLGSRHTVGAFVIKPAVYLGGLTSRDELAVSTDQIYEYSAGLGIDIPEMRITSTIKAGQNVLQKTSGEESAKEFANASIYYRPQFLDKLNQGMLFLRIIVNDFSFTTSEKNFRETSAAVGLNMQF